MVDIKRSEKTVFRKATKVPHLNAALVKEISKDNLMRNNSAYTAFKTIRGTSMYFEDKKKDLMAYIRQLGPPTVFCTLSAAEFDWDDLAKSIYETKTNQTVTMEYIQQQDPAWRHKLIAENVVSVQIPSVINFGKNEDVISMKSGWNIGGTYPRNGSKNVTQSKKVQFAVVGRIPKSKRWWCAPRM